MAQVFFKDYWIVEQVQDLRTSDPQTEVYVFWTPRGFIHYSSQIDETVIQGDFEMDLVPWCNDLFVVPLEQSLHQLLMVFDI